LTEDQLGLDRGQRRDVQRRLNGLGFDTKVTGKFDDGTRSVIKRWQAARGYPVSGFLNKPQHKALLSEIVSSQTSSDDASSDRSSRHVRHFSGGAAGGGYHRSGDPGSFMGGVLGGMMGGMFRR
jgi:peptidoglycan hydrolase-like protein with peptidoglycan-binding domain